MVDEESHYDVVQPTHGQTYSDYLAMIKQEDPELEADPYLLPAAYREDFNFSQLEAPGFNNFCNVCGTARCARVSIYV